MSGQSLKTDTAAAYWAFKMPVAQLSITATCLNEGRLPRHLGSALRGVLGHALMRAHGRPCDAAPGRASNGLYASIFEPMPAAGSLFERQRAVAPAFVFRAPLLPADSWHSGRLLRFEWVLLGPAVELFEPLALALQSALNDGLGLHPPRVRFHLDRIEVQSMSGPQMVFQSIEARQAQLFPLLPETCTATHSSPSQGELTLELLSPLHIRSKKKLIEAPTFRDIARAMLMRLESVAGFGQMERRPDAPALLQCAESVEVSEQHLRRVDYSRYSQRQGQRVPLSGMLGSIRFAGPVGVVHGLLPLAEIAHLGHGTAWGMGQVRAALHPRSRGS